VEQAIPTIYAPPAKPIRLSLTGRLLSLAASVACLTVAIIAWKLPPSPSGVGSHHKLGMLPCNMLEVTGIPCPSCGMTTSFAWFYKAHLVGSLYVQPAGFVLAYLTAVVCVLGLYQAMTGRPIHRLLKIVSIRIWVPLAIGVLAFGWGWKIMIHLSGRDGW
jgi:hypothetical protein